MAMTGTVTEDAPAVKLTVGGTRATFGLLELRFTVNPLPDAAGDRSRVTF
jgi:hypothetical protein